MYKVTYKGKEIELPKYNSAMAKKISELDKLEGEEFEIIKSLYDFIFETIGEEKTLETLGVFEEADVNDILILFKSIVDSYQKPYADYQIAQTTKVLDNPQIRETLSAIDKMVKAK